MQRVLEVDEKSEGLMRKAAVVFWESHFGTPFPCNEQRSSLPSITEKSALPLNADFEPTKSIQSMFPLKNTTSTKVGKQVKSEISTMIKLKSANLDQTDSADQHKTTSLSQSRRKASELKKSFSVDAYDSVRNKRAQRSIHLQRRLPSLPPSSTSQTGGSNNDVNKLRAVDAIVRADLIHGRREGTVEEFDELKGFTASGLSESASGKSTLSRSSSLKGSRVGSSSATTPSSSRRSSLDSEPEGESLHDIIERSPALQEAIAVNILLPSFARNTISSLIQHMGIQGQGASQHAIGIAVEKTKSKKLF